MPETSGYPHPELLETTEWLAAHLGDEALVILDGRGAQEYGEGHIPGAIHVAMPAFKASGSLETCSPEEFAEAAGTLGVGPSDTVICYDAGGPVATDADPLFAPTPPPGPSVGEPAGDGFDPLFDPLGVGFGPPAAPVPPPGETPDPGTVPPSPVPERRGAFAIARDGISWRCDRCDTANALAAWECRVCGTRFGHTVQPTPARPDRDPNMAALFSLFWPGADVPLSTAISEATSSVRIFEAPTPTSSSSRPPLRRASSTSESPPFDCMIIRLPLKPSRRRRRSRAPRYWLTFGPTYALATTVEVRSYSRYSRESSCEALRKSVGSA